MRIDEQVTLGRAFDSARSGINRAQSRLDRTADSVASLTARDSAAAGVPVAEGRNLVDDMVELSRAGVEAQVNATTYRVASDVFDELSNLGRRVDMRV